MRQPPPAPGAPEVRSAASLCDPGPAGAEALALAQECGLSLTVADHLHRRGHRAGAALDRWLDPRLAQLSPPWEMADLKRAAARLAHAIEARERVAVFGDYDCDGITATAIVVEAVRALGGDAVGLLANRFAGGYGFSAPALERVQKTGAELLVTCDCGSADHERLQAAREAGIEAIVVDHHLVPPEPLPALAFLNPHRPDCGFSYQGLASCGLALLLAIALRKQRSAELDVRRWLDLVAVGTVADVAPLDGDNRVLVRAGLGRIGAAGRPGLMALAPRGAGGRLLPVRAEDVAFRIAPRINAAGRLGDPMPALRLLLEQDAATAQRYAAELEQLTGRRRELQRTMIAEALSQVAEHHWADDPAIIVASSGWHPGVVGIVAGRLADRLGKPAIVVAMDGARGRGSARAPKGFRLHDSLVACAEQLIGFGGHQAAAGVELAAADLDAFRRAWGAACAEQQRDQAPVADSGQPDVRLDRRDELERVLGDLERLEPCGQANAAPRLLLPAAAVRSARAVKGHLKLDLEVNGERLGGFWPDRGALAGGLAGGCLEVVGAVRRDRWRGGGAAEILVEAVFAAAR